MSPTAKQLLSPVLALPDADRRALVEAVIESLEPSERPPFHDTWLPVIARRSAELRAGTVTPIPWAELERRARESIGA